MDTIKSICQNVRRIGKDVVIYQGDVQQIAAEVPAESVQCVVTSPPYYGLRDYGVSGSEWPEITYTPMAALPEMVVPAWFGCLGLEPTPALYVAHLVHIFRQLRQVLRKDGTLWLNLGDSYAGSWGSASHDINGKGRRAGTNQRPPTSYKQKGLKPKDLIGIPWRVAFALQADGWYLRSDIIWHKPNPMPESVTDRPTKAHEYLFLLAKDKRYYYDIDAVREPHASEWIGRSIKTSKGNNDRNDGGKACETGNPAGRNKRTVWTITPKPYKGAHFATFPPALVEPCILAGSKPGDTVLDPFAGSGTTAAVAIEHGRQFIGFEINPAYIDMAAARVEAAATEER